MGNYGSRVLTEFVAYDQADHGKMPMPPFFAESQRLRGVQIATRALNPPSKAKNQGKKRGSRRTWAPEWRFQPL